jgi:hypothetical protein
MAQHERAKESNTLPTSWMGDQTLSGRLPVGTRFLHHFYMHARMKIQIQASLPRVPRTMVLLAPSAFGVSGSRFPRRGSRHARLRSDGSATGH